MIISILSYKGGTGKSTSALHLSGCLAKKGETLLIDGDLNRSALEWSERGNNGLPFKVIDREEAHRYAGKFEYVVVDTAARPEPRQLKAIISGCDRLVVTTSPDAVSMAALKPAIIDLRTLNAEFSILLTMVPPVGRAGEIARQAFEAQGLPVFKTMIRRYTAYQKAGMSGCLVCDVSDDYAQEAWNDYQHLTKEIFK
jgi:chromosome partitioning protein